MFVVLKPHHFPQDSKITTTLIKEYIGVKQCNHPFNLPNFSASQIHQQQIYK